MFEPLVILSPAKAPSAVLLTPVLFAVVDVVHHYDYHATLLKLFGIYHTALSYKWSNRDQTLTDNQEGRIVEEILA